MREIAEAQPTTPGGRPRDAGAPGPEGPAPPALEARAEGGLRLRDRAAPRAALRGRLSLV